MELKPSFREVVEVQLMRMISKKKGFFSFQAHGVRFASLSIAPQWRVYIYFTDGALPSCEK
jgi:hypothetical protein